MSHMYLWFKALHLIFMVAWFAGLFYIFRLFVYHVKFKDKPELCAAYEIMEKKLITIIMTPAAVLNLSFGLSMLHLNPTILSQHWFLGKVVLLLPLWGYHVFSEWTRRRFARGDFFLSEKACRLLNEVPTMSLFGIVLLAVLKPWMN